MKEYKKPLVEVVEIETEDVITASTGEISAFSFTNKDGTKTIALDINYSADIFGE